MNYLGNNKTFKDEETQWDRLDLAMVDEKVINQLLNQLKLNLSDDFYISFESLLKIGKKAEREISSYVSEIDETHKFKKQLLNFLLDFIRNNEIDTPLVLQLYHPDFIVRAKAIMNIKTSGAINKYLRFLIPLVGDPDDSVRWAVIKLFITCNQIKKPAVLKKLKSQMKKESNQVIREKIQSILS